MRVLGDVSLREKMKKLSAVKPKYKGCLKCGPEVQKLSMKRELAVGFGCVTVTRDGKTIWAGDWLKQFHPIHKDLKRCYTIMRFENAARKSPGDWRVKFGAPLNSSTFQRQGKNLWVLVAQGGGFA